MATCRANCKVLVIDDSADFANLVGQYAEGEPIEVLVVATGEEGLEKLKETQFDFVLMDFHLPGMDGAAAVRSVRLLERQLKRRRVPVFALTDLLDRDSGEQMLRADCTALVGKPLSRQQFLTIASRWRRPTLEPGPEQDPPLKPLRILIAEDSADNRLLLQVYLTGSPHQLTFAGNGKLAVDHFAAESFDLILMDMEMPIMDGSAATRAIRAIEHARGTVPIPIVAISASKRAQDAALSGEAGWNRHLFKPLSKHKLLNAIEECAPMQYAAKAGLPQMMENDRFPSLRQIVPGYLAARQKELLEMRALLAASSFAKIITIAHNLKGTGHSYGFAPLTQLGGALEHAAKQADTAAMDMQLREISDYLDRVQMPANA